MFKKGMKRYPGAGRTKGVQNRKKIAKVAELLAEKCLNPTEEILRLMPELAPKDQVIAWLDLLSYCQPKLKAVEVSAAPNEILDGEEDVLVAFRDVTDEALLKLVESKDEPS